MNYRTHTIALALAALTFGCSTDDHAPKAHGGAPTAVAVDAPPAAPREFRAAWVATVDNIDWPSKKGLSVADQQREIVAICDRAQQVKLNCLIVQVRPSADATYASPLEPWSFFLTGAAGQPPSPAYDPLVTWIDECHRRGIELHAWFNPYRVRQFASQPLAANSVAKTHPEIVKQYGEKLWLDPGEPLAAKISLAVFNDVVRRYDVDGIHIDDYFYPYPDDDPKTKKEMPFPDDASWNRFKRTHPVKPNPATAPADVEKVARADWRRGNVNQLVEEVYRTTKQIKPWVKFGISPFGLGRPNAAPGIRGFDQYEKLYADAALWLNNGWCDYFTPQLYWAIDPPAQSFPVLFDYWRSENKKDRHIWPGMFTGLAVTKKKNYTPLEIENQIKITRKDPDAGHVHFSMKNLMGDVVTPTLIADVYQQDALVPASPWLDPTPPPAPAKVTLAATTLALTPGRGEPTWAYAIWTRANGEWTFQTAPGTTTSLTLKSTPTDVVVSAVDRCGNESVRVTAR